MGHLFRILSKYFTNKANDVRICTVYLSITKQKKIRSFEKWTNTEFVYREVDYNKIFELPFKTSKE